MLFEGGAMPGFDWAQAWRDKSAMRKRADGVEFWNNRAPSFAKTAGVSPYARTFLELADVHEGETVFDCLNNVCYQKKIHLDSKKDSVYGTYVKGINYLYEFHAGKNSGWMFKVNGESPNYGCDKCKLTDGDKIEWYYVTRYND